MLSGEIEMASDRDEFEYPRPYYVVSKAGFAVEVQPPYRIQYTESDRRMQVFADVYGDTVWLGGQSRRRNRLH